MVNFELYRIFKIVADEENITKASIKLNISQPAITTHIKNLERILNMNLFERTNTGVKLTHNGKDIYEDIKGHIEALENIYKKYGEKRNIYIGIHAAMLNTEFDKKIQDSLNAENINIMNYNADEMLQKIENQEIDMAISKKHPKYNNAKTDFISLGKLHDVLVCSFNSVWINKELTKEDFKNIEIYLPRHNSITEINFFNSVGVDESEFKNTRNISYISMLNEIKDSDKIGLITKEYIKEELKNKSIVEIKTDFQIKPIEYGIYYNKENVFNELKILIEKIKSRYN